jgi:hypothetical protein
LRPQRSSFLAEIAPYGGMSCIAIDSRHSQAAWTLDVRRMGISSSSSNVDLTGRNPDPNPR